MPEFKLRMDAISPRGPLVNIEAVLRGIQRAQNLYAGQVIHRGQHYPPERPNQKYVRSQQRHHIKNSWKVIPSRRVGDTQEVSIINIATDSRRRAPKQYAVYVFGFDALGTGQSIWHVGRWPIQGKLLNVDSYHQQIHNAIERAINTGGTSSI